MKKILLSTIFTLATLFLTGQTTHNITNAGNTYTPDSIEVMVGDTVVFNVGPSHPTLEVDQATWQANGSTALPGGFDYPNGSGKLYIASAQTYYYICQVHISMGMKGKIVAKANTIGLTETINRKIEVYPNPVSDILNINSENATSAELYSMDGKLIESLELKAGKNSFDLNHLAAGSYILKTKDSSEFKFTKK